MPIHVDDRKQGQILVGDVRSRRRRRRRATLGVAAVALVSAIAGGTVVALTIDRSPAALPVSPALPAAGPAGASWAPIATRAARGVVELTVTRTIRFKAREGVPSEAETESIFGTGFVIDARGSIVTNEHVLEGGGSISVHLADGTIAPGVLVGSDASTDIAVVRVHVGASHLHPLTLGRSSSLRLGSPVLAIGTPFGYAGSVSAGIVSGFDRQIASPGGYAMTDAIQTDAAVNHGNSGGPLLDAGGAVVGVTSQIAKGVSGNVGVSFAIPLDAGIRRVIAQLSTTGTALHAWLGVAGTTIDARRARAIGLPAVRGVAVTGIQPGSPAARAGLVAGGHVVLAGSTAFCGGGDVLVSLGGARITSTSGSHARSSATARDPSCRSASCTPAARTPHTLTLAAQPARRPRITTSC